MVPWYWVLVAFFVGGALGCLASGFNVAADEGDRKDCDLCWVQDYFELKKRTPV